MILDKMTTKKVGVGLRPEHYQIIETTKPSIDFLEIHSENYFNQKSSDSERPANLSDEDYQKSIESLSMPAPVWVEIPLEDPHYDSMPAPKIVEVPLNDP